MIICINIIVDKGVRIGGSAGDGPSSGVGSKSTRKPILQFDVSQHDQVICAGTELLEEDSYLLFWDIRSSKLLGAYWESHSDDVTAVRFHPSLTHSLATGSTDGLLNVFNLLEPSEDDALLYSLNTESSVVRD
jgi:WD40 repeat protein